MVMRFDDDRRRRLETGITALLAGDGDWEWRGPWGPTGGAG